MFSKIFAVSLIAASALFVFPSQVQTQALSSNVRVAVAQNGLNVRDGNCVVQYTIGYGNVVVKMSGTKKTCKFNNTSYSMIDIGDNRFVAEQYTKPVKSNSNLSDPFTFTVNAVGGLNLRDTNCKRKGAVPNGTVLKIPDGLSGIGINICQRDGVFYSMFPAQYNGKVYQVADYYLK